MSSRFAEKLYMALPSEGNLFFSPFSVAAALGRAATGARGETRREILEVLGLSDLGDFELMRQITEQEAAVLAAPGITIEAANKLYLEADFGFRGEFLQLMRHFQAGIEMVDFRNASSAVIDRINDWVAQQTHGRIKDILAPGSLDEETRMALVNAVYFKAAWQYAYAEELTHRTVFHQALQETAPVWMMHQETNRFRYWEDGQLQILGVPYQGQRLWRLYILPRIGVSLRKVEERVAREGILPIFDSLWTHRNVQVYVPKFEMGWGTFDITSQLIEMGIRAAFSDNADFFGMVEDGEAGLYLSNAFHKAWVEDNELGSEAAAATVLVAKELCASPNHKPQSIVFRADWPFMFGIVDSETEEILFLGRMTDPTVS